MRLCTTLQEKSVIFRCQVLLQNEIMKQWIKIKNVREVQENIKEDLSILIRRKTFLSIKGKAKKRKYQNIKNLNIEVKSTINKIKSQKTNLIESSLVDESRCWILGAKAGNRISVSKPGYTISLPTTLFIQK